LKKWGIYKKYPKNKTNKIGKLIPKDPGQISSSIPATVDHVSAGKPGHSLKLKFSHRTTATSAGTHPPSLFGLEKEKMEEVV
jgi:hypothetical protein